MLVLVLLAVLVPKLVPGVYKYECKEQVLLVLELVLPVALSWY